MNLTCNHCRHRWDDDVEDESTEVWCSRCGKSTPIQLALHPGESRPSPGGAPSDPGSDVTYVEAAGGESAGGEAVQLGSDPTVGGGEATELGEVTTGGHSDLGVPPAESAAMGSLAKSMEHLIGQNIDGFRFEKILGAGGMGAVFRAHQVSLDRDVAIKVLPSRFAEQPDLVARFTREALSAAQLTHHNIIQVYDVGSSEQIHYISMEYVRGDSLGGMVRRDGRIKIDDAAGYILQASRGLEYAHRRGIIHRDIKPDNLMVDEHGIVKIADMGLAKRIGIEEANGGPAGRARDEALKSMTDVNLTRADVAMGTPAYMAPEQGRDARAVDARADQYSLGCTLYYLCAGRAPYSGTTAFELMSKHMSEPLTPLTTHVKGVPPAFGRIIERMLEKDPEARYPSLVEAGQDLESYLGIDTAQGPYTPREMHVAILETALADYYAAASIPKRRMAKLGFFVLMGALFLGSIFARQFTLAGGILGLLVLTPVAGFTLDGIKNKRFLFRRVRSVFFGMPWKSWFMVGAGTLLGAGALWVLGWHWYWMGFAVVAAGLAAVYQWGVARPLEAERRKPIERIHQTLRELRIRGVAEGALQDFVSRFSGVHWEEFFEELFGYEAMIVARGKWAAADQVKPRKKHATWREPIARALEGIEEARKKAKEKKQLAKVETARLKAQGVSESEAQKKAAEEATRIVSEGFIQPPPEEKEKAEKKEKEKDEGDKWAKSGKRSLAALAPPLVRAIFGAGLVAGYLIQQFNLSLPGPLADLLSRYYGWGLGGRVDALVAGVAVIASAFSKRFGLPWLVVVGAAMLVLRVPLIDLVDRPQFSEFTVFIGASLLILLGIGPSVTSKLSGGKF